VRGAAKNAVPHVLKEHAYYEALTWWFTMQGIGQDLRARYEVPKDLPPKLLTLVRKLDHSDWLFPAFSWQNDVDFFP
jgi:hypothetical protein